MLLTARSLMPARSASASCVRLARDQWCLGNAPKDKIALVDRVPSASAPSAHVPRPRASGRAQSLCSTPSFCSTIEHLGHIFVENPASHFAGYRVDHSWTRPPGGLTIDHVAVPTDEYNGKQGL